MLDAEVGVAPHVAPADAVLLGARRRRLDERAALAAMKVHAGGVLADVRRIAETLAPCTNGSNYTEEIDTNNTVRLRVAQTKLRTVQVTQKGLTTVGLHPGGVLDDV